MQEDFDGALERVVAGMQSSRRLTEHERRVIAFHEAGHALCAELLPGVDRTHKISIVPRGNALGYTLHFPEEDRYLKTRAELLDRMTVLLGGRAAEEMVFGSVTTGASDDLKQVARISRSMIHEWAMGTSVSALQLVEEGGAVSDRTRELRDAEQQYLADEAMRRAEKLLTDHRTQLDQFAQQLRRTGARARRHRARHGRCADPAAHWPHRPARGRGQAAPALVSRFRSSRAPTGRLAAPGGRRRSRTYTRYALESPADPATTIGPAMRTRTSDSRHRPTRAGSAHDADDDPTVRLPLHHGAPDDRRTGAAVADRGGRDSVPRGREGCADGERALTAQRQFVTDPAGVVRVALASDRAAVAQAHGEPPDLGAAPAVSREESNANRARSESVACSPACSARPRNRGMVMAGLPLRERAKARVRRSGLLCRRLRRSGGIGTRRRRSRASNGSENHAVVRAVTAEGGHTLHVPPSAPAPGPRSVRRSRRP